MKKVAIIGGGFGALNVAWQLSNITGPDKLQIDVFEQDQQLAGMAGGFKEKNWAWTLDKHYHHLFAKDRAFQKFLKSLGLEEKLFLEEYAELRNSFENMWNKEAECGTRK